MSCPKLILAYLATRHVMSYSVGQNILHIETFDCVHVHINLGSHNHTIHNSLVFLIHVNFKNKMYIFV